MDKSWMSKSRLSEEYDRGVEYFLKRAEENAQRRDWIQCPCTKCMNCKKISIGEIKNHLYQHGFDETYTHWVHHGEDSPSVASSSKNAGEPFHWDNGMDMPDDFMETIEMTHAAKENFTGNLDKLTKLLEDGEKPMYKGCKKYTKLSTLVNLYNMKAKGGWSDITFVALLKFLKKLLPEDNELPTSLSKVKETLSTFGMDYEKIHACPNDCILYRNEHASEVSCPTCGTSRYKELKCNTEKKNTVPAKVLWYFPPIARFRKMYQSIGTSKNMVWHADGRVALDGQMRHPADSPAWKMVDSKWPEFAAEPRNLRLALSTDGINPHSTLSSRYSCWPVMLVTYNLPPWLCMKRKFMLLTMLISGPRQPGNDIDVYFAPLIEDLKMLWHIGVDMYDAYLQESFTLKAVLLWTISDFPALGNLAGCTVKGYFACPVCSEETDSTRLAHCKKNVYQAHRRLLPRHHRFRKLRKAFNGKKELRSSPKALSGQQILEKVSGLTTSWGKLKGSLKKAKTTKRKGGEESNVATENTGCWKKKSIFFELEYWEHLLVRHNLDVMHIEKNVCDSIVGTLLNIPGKTKDGIKCRLDLKDLNLRGDLAPQKKGNQTYLPPACYTLSKNEKEVVCRTLHDLKVPDGFGSNFCQRVSMQDKKLYGLKSHDCHILMQQLLPVAIRSVLPKHVRYSIIRLCFFFNALCAKVVDVSSLDKLQEDLVVTICLLEMYFPPPFFDIMVHLTVHLVREVKLCGPVFFRWMYPFERYMKVLKGYVRNRARPEGCIAENYIAEEAVEFCTEYLIELEAVGVPSSRNMQNNEEEDTVFDGRPIGGSKLVEVDKLSWEQAHRCVLENTIDVQPYIEEHTRDLKLQNPRKSAKWLQDEHNRTFIYWLRQRVQAETNTPDNNVSDTLKAIAQGPRRDVTKCTGYVISGCRFHTKDREQSLVNQNSGVSLNATTLQVASAKDKNPVTSLMTYYGVITEIWLLDYWTLKVPLFKCDWVDNNNGIEVDELGFTSVELGRVSHKSDPFVLASQAKQVFYVPDQLKPNWSIVLVSPERDYHHDDNDEELVDAFNSEPSLGKELPDIDIDENPSSYIRADCEGTWIKHKKTKKKTKKIIGESSSH